ncbi:translation initiation factor IF-2-like [Hordeum vulgare subsp. vulgare]|uniref:Predicted protein n=1 Tax=Hordeum vulgare subsp. vulgare TaxID=112509 RepID=F2DMQ5_HORVV|nr:translation initiation factor IF-2-like [Hordeum vulgare subsp. vulgare]BAJ96376.1 predicted protein [Hordeum vulgare subsp. vulgare]
MERNGGAPAPSLAIAVCLLCCLASSPAAYSVPADPRRHPPSASPARGGHHHGPGPAASPHRRHHHRGISPVPASPHYAPAPAPTAGADGLPSPHPPVPVYTRAPEPQTTTTPHFGFPLEPTVGVAARGPSSGALPRNGAGGDGYPFIGSNPTVPLPTGVTDTATVRPLPDTASNDDNRKVAGRAAEPVRAGAAMIGLVMAVLSTTAMLVSSWS